MQFKIQKFVFKNESGIAPYKLFEKLHQDGRQIVILENGWGGEWSFVCVVNSKIKVPIGETGLKFMRNFLVTHPRVAKKGESPFVRGFVGFLSYDLGEKWVSRDQAASRPDSQMPEVYFVYTDKVFAFKKQRSDVSGQISVDAGAQGSALKLNLSRKQYFEKIKQIKKYLYDGETYQVNFSQKFSAPFRGDAFELYKKMTKINPSPFQFFMETSQFAVISNSPERLLRIKNAPKDKIIETRPIKGTAPRGKTTVEDKRNIAAMLASKKEKAELEMIVDLERNDLGKICKPGTVEVNENRVVEKYSHVFHTVSNVRGILRPECDFLDALHALFPGGSVTGCPKKRTMEIIRRLERESRGIYCGSAGFIDLSGECDFNIMIRTLYLDKKTKSPKIIFRSGGGIVVDSDPQKEYEETLHKSQALISAIL